MDCKGQCCKCGKRKRQWDNDNDDDTNPKRPRTNPRKYSNVIKRTSQEIGGDLPEPKKYRQLVVPQEEIDAYRKIIGIERDPELVLLAIKYFLKDCKIIKKGVLIKELPHLTIGELVEIFR